MRDDHIRMMLNRADSDDARRCLKLWSENERRFSLSPGSTHNHQAWPGGYLDHVHDTMMTAVRLYTALPQPLPFNLNDAVLVLFLHDVEKPWRYVEPVENMASKEARRLFRVLTIAQAGIALTNAQANALYYVEGEGADYRSDRRVMNELAAFCHMCDVASARIYHSKPETPPLYATLDA